MTKYLKKTITEDNGNQSTAFMAVELKANLTEGIAYVKEGGWKSGQKIADGKPQSLDKPILWVEPDINTLVTLQSYNPGVPLTDVLFDTIGYRMQTLDSKPDGSGPNPFKGCLFEDIPTPS